MPSKLLKITKQTVLKRSPVDSSQLPDNEKVQVFTNEYSIAAWSLNGNHIKFTLNGTEIQGSNIWFAFGEHVQVLENGKVVYPTKEIRLAVPHKSQLDNVENPYGSCNVTSVAMVLQFLGIPRKTSQGQFEDELYRYCISQGYSRHDPHDLAKVIRDYGAKDTFKTDATIEELKDWLTGGNPAIIHGYFTRFGHIVVVKGFNEKGFIVSDPYGEYFPSGYRTDLSGDGVVYSYQLIKETCIPDGSFWVHFVSK